MNRALLKHALVISAATLLTTTAYAQSPNADPHAKGHAAEPAKAAATAGAKVQDKTESAVDKGKEGKEAKDKLDGKADKAGAEGKDLGDRTARKAKEHAAQKAKLGTMLKGPMDEPVKQELRRHAERLARIERVKSVAEGAKDTDVAERATKLLAKENARHDKWMEKHVATPSATPGTAAAPAHPAQAGSKGGEK